MANTPHPKRNLVIEDLLNGLAPKLIAAKHDMLYGTVIAIKERCFDTALKLKRNLPDPRQLTFKW